KKKACFAYEVVCTNAGYEVRHYNASKWVSTSVRSYFMEMAIHDGFRKLFKYIKGANTDGVNIDMTSPVLIKNPEARDTWEPATYTISFLLPAAYQDAAPALTNEDVHILEMPEMHAYVKSFGGWMVSVNSRLYSLLLSRELNAASASYNTTFYYGAGYNRSNGSRIFFSEKHESKHDTCRQHHHYNNNPQDISRSTYQRNTTKIMDESNDDMTSPVLIKNPEARDTWEPATYTISFLLPAAYQDAAPALTNEDVHILEMPEMHAYVKSFGGWMVSVNSRLYSLLLSRELNAASASYNTTFYYGAGYNSPWTVFNQHNEVWYIAEGKPKCSGQQT
ncbi:uncharacterized protein LOC121308057, partial [Polyodon spathula]|uniref:uncharacterized protein LOC121308057 n=1 Tax=Polyodon spathula TaxID=7913 RepID=UPI001B7EED48